MNTTDHDGLWRRIRFTPLHQVILGRPTGSLDLEAIIARGGIPEDLAELVRDTVRRTRLHRWQKAEVTEDLVEHFREGLAGGETAEHLHAQFGDPSAASVLIRRSMMRKQSWAVRQARMVVKVGLVFFATVIVVYLGIALNDWRQRPNIATDHVALMNAPITATDMDQRAWPLVREGLLLARDRMVLGPDPDPGIDEAVARDRRLRRLLTSAQAELVDWRGPVPTVLADFEDPLPAGIVDGFFDQVDPIRTMLLEAAGRPILGFEIMTAEASDPRDRALFNLGEPLVASVDMPAAAVTPLDGSLLMVQLPHLSSIRLATRLLDADARRAVVAGEGGRAVEDLEGMLRLAAHVGEPPFLISQLVATAIDQMVFDTLIDGLSAFPESFDDEELKAITAMLERLEDRRFVMDLSFEALSFDDLAQRIYTDDGDGDGRLSLGGMAALNGNMAGGGFGAGAGEPGMLQFILAPMLSRLMLSRAEATGLWHEIFDQYHVAASKPPWEIDRATLSTIRGVSIAELGADPMSQIRFFPLPLLVPGLDTAIFSGSLRRAECDLALTVTAIEAARRRSGEWPATLEDAGLARLPRDPMDGSTLRYQVLEGTPMLWSVGPDRDDDGGAAIMPTRATTPRWGPSEERAGLRSLVRHMGADVPAASGLDGDVVVWRGPGSSVSPRGSAEAED